MFRRKRHDGGGTWRASTLLRSGTFVAALACFGSASAAPTSVTPRGLYGKSVVIEWTEARVQRREGAEFFRDVDAEMQISLYFSTEGRVFGRVTPTVRGMSGNVDQRIGDSEGKRQWAMAFNGTSAIFFTPFFKKAAVRKVAMTFDAAFSTCAAQVSYGKLSDTEVIRAFSPIAHLWVEIQSVTPSSASCAVQNGNVFAN